MSHIATHWAWSQRGISPSIKLVLLALADHADPELQCFPGHAQVGHETGLSRSTVKRAVDELVVLGLISRDTAERPNGSSSTNVYRLGVGVHGDPPQVHGEPTPGFMVDPHRIKPLPIDPKIQGLSARPNINSTKVGQQAEVYSAGDAVAYFVDCNRAKGIVFASSVKGQVARAVLALVADGIDRELIEQAIEMMVAKGLNPSTLPSLIGTVQSGRPRQTTEEFNAIQRKLEEEEQRGS